MTDRSLIEKSPKGMPRTILFNKDENIEYPPNIFGDLKQEIVSFAWNLNKIHSLQDGVFSKGILFAQRVLYPLDKMNTFWANLDLEYFERCVGKSFATQLPKYESVWLKTGRLCATIEGDGKRRIVETFTYRWYLLPGRSASLVACFKAYGCIFI
jgi:hypothetical protein